MLPVLLATAFTAALVAVCISITDNVERINRLYDGTIVEADLLYARSGYDCLGTHRIKDAFLSNSGGITVTIICWDDWVGSLFAESSPIFVNGGAIQQENSVGCLL